MIKQEWESYRKACWGNQVLHPEQERECKQAFYSGAFDALNLVIKAMDENPLYIEKTFDKFYQEIKTEIGAMIGARIK